MKKFIIGLVLGLLIITGINASFFDSIINTITPWKYVKSASNTNLVYKTMLFTQTGYNASGVIQTGSAVTCINCAGNNYFDGVTAIGTTLGTTTFTNGFSQSAGSGLAWNDIQNLSIAIGGTVAQQPALINLTGSNIQVRCFDGGSQMNEMFGQAELPHDMRTGSILDPHAHLYGTTTSATTTGILYLDYEFLKNGTINNTLPMTGTISLPIYGFTGNLYKVLEINGDISISGFTLGDNIVFRVYRTPTGVDTYAGSICLLQVGFHYQIDTNGSRTEYTK